MRWIVFLSGLLWVLPAFSVERGTIATEKKFSLSKLQKTYKQAGSLEADFVQEVYQASLARTKTSKGTIQLKSPNRVRWEIHEPEASVLVSNGKKLWYFNPDARGKGKGQAMQRSPRELETQPIFRILTGSAPLEKDFKVLKTEKVEGITKDQKHTAVTLEPKKPLADLKEATLKVDSKYMISELILENHSGNRTKITLQNQVLGANLPPALFEFKPPEGTEVLRN